MKDQIINGYNYAGILKLAEAIETLHKNNKFFKKETGLNFSLSQQAKMVLNKVLSFLESKEDKMIFEVEKTKERWNENLNSILEIFKWEVHLWFDENLKLSSF